MPAFTLPVQFAMRLPSDVAFTLGTVSVYWYGVLLAAGIVAAILMASLEMRRLRLPGDTAVDLCLIAIPCGIVGSRLVHVLVNPAAYNGDFVAVLRIWDGGMSVYGALFFALVGIVLYIAAKKLSFYAVMDAVAPGLLLARGITLWGDFFNQRGYGPAVTARSLTWFPFAVRIEETGAIHCAVFFYEFVWCVLCFCVLWFLVRRKAKRTGMVFLTYVLLTALGHGVFETLRINSTSLAGGTVKTAQVVCGILFLAALALLLVRARQPMELKGEEAASNAPEEPAEQASADSAAAPAEPEKRIQHEEKEEDDEHADHEPTKE